MSSVIKPVGPEEPRIYWRRRALFAGIVVLVLFLLWLLFFRPSNEPVPVASPSPSASVTESATGSPTASASPSSPSPSPSIANACADDDIGVAVTTNAETYPAGDLPQITMTITNEGSVACDRDVGSNANSILVSSGGVDVWSSDHCATDNAPDVVTLQPEDRATVTVEWARVITEPGCPTNQPEVEPGAYVAVGKNGDVRSPKARFTLE